MIEPLAGIYSAHPLFQPLAARLQAPDRRPVCLKGLSGSAAALLACSLIRQVGGTHWFIFPEYEQAVYFHDDLNNVCPSENLFLFPSSFRRTATQIRPDEGNIILRTRVLSRLLQGDAMTVITCPEALMERVLTGERLRRNSLTLKKGERLSIDFIREVLGTYEFTLTDFVYEPGQYAIRGSIVDIFSYAHYRPFRIDFFGDEVESIRTFDISTQLSDEPLDEISIVPDMQKILQEQSGSSVFDAVSPGATFWTYDLTRTFDIWKRSMDATEQITDGDGEEIRWDKSDRYVPEDTLRKQCLAFRQVEFGMAPYTADAEVFAFNTAPQPVFQKNFALMAERIAADSERGYRTGILSENPKQFDRLDNIFEGTGMQVTYERIPSIVHEGFTDHDLRICLYTDHQIFDRYHKYKQIKTHHKDECLTIQELQGLHPGDYVVHIDHGVGIFGGLEKIDVNGREQECIRLVYRDNDLLYVNISNLHKISKYRGKEGESPKINKLGSAAWQTLKQSTKRKVKDIAKELIALYAKRKMQKGFAFSPDNFLQEELEASFIYEDTPDQMKATQAVKHGMESDMPMDHLVCGDVGFGKTEIAIRAAFKAVCDSKQVAVLVPTTILAMQHASTFKERLAHFPARVESLSRLKTAQQTREIMQDVADGKIDILVGTHKILNKNLKFKDLGLLIIDEEQKFGVAAKEKLKTLRTNVDTLTLSATPIPRTLQFSLLGIRDLSILMTPPSNRYPIQTELIPFNQDIIREAVEYEVARGGQVFFINNRIQNLAEIGQMIERICPHVKTICAHGQMDGKALEKIMLDFVSGDYDVLVATSIIESGLDIPNVNTIFINEAQHFGLSDLHQMRGRVGRTNKRAFCYLITPPLNDLNPDARRRLRAIEEFSDLGSGFNIAMQDLDIRGAGNMMGAEQSGFIADVGFETYHQILDEALLELRDDPDFTTFFTDQDRKRETLAGELHEEKLYVTDCQIDTDLEMMLPESYVENVSERIRLYRQLDNLEDEKALETFTRGLIDRFGPVPPQAEALIDVVRLRRKAKRLGFEKLTLRNGKLLAYFVGDSQSPYYQSPVFGRILAYVQQNPRLFRMKETNGRLVLTISPVNSIREIIGTLDRIQGAA
ncbi:MAG: transcription-repair coupling factor [Bacteroidales bacterium]|nr:transcription-repair coupling factor [Bacteroidales bacterium]